MCYNIYLGYIKIELSKNTHIVLILSTWSTKTSFQFPPFALLHWILLSCELLHKDFAYALDIQCNLLHDLDLENSKQGSCDLQLFCQHQQIVQPAACCLYVLHPLTPALCWCTDFLFREGKPVCHAGEFQRKGNNPSAVRLSLCYNSADKTTDPYLPAASAPHRAEHLPHECHVKHRSLVLLLFMIIWNKLWQLCVAMLMRATFVLFCFDFFQNKN